MMHTKANFTSFRPENILMRSETQPIITDFDISKDSSQTRKTSLSRSPGTAEYMAPELLGAEPVEATAASDMWSFGVVTLRVRCLCCNFFFFFSRYDECLIY
jgi:serine/threonine protein kinase